VASSHTAQKRGRTNANGSKYVAVGRAYTTTTSSLRDGKACRGWKAMDALDKATARKNAFQLKGQLLPVSRISSHCRLSHDSVLHTEEPHQNESDDGLNDCSDDARITSEARTNAKRAHSDEIQLMMKTCLPHASIKRRHTSNSDTIKNFDDNDGVQRGQKSAFDLATAAPSSLSRKTTQASFSPRRNGRNTASYFKPPLAERSYPAYKPHLFFGNDLSTSLS